MLLSSSSDRPGDKGRNQVAHNTDLITMVPGADQAGDKPGDASGGHHSHRDPAGDNVSDHRDLAGDPSFSLLLICCIVVAKHRSHTMIRSPHHSCRITQKYALECADKSTVDTESCATSSVHMNKQVSRTSESGRQSVALL